MTPSTITQVEAIVTKPDKHNLVVVRVTTDAGVWGLGCATFQFRPWAVRSAVDDYLRPLLLGRDANDIEDLWHVMRMSSYWRNGPVLNNAIAGVDMALWDVKGKLAGMPLYQLLGGRSRTAIPAYAHAVADDLDGLYTQIDRHLADGYRHVRVQLGFYGGNATDLQVPENPLPGSYYDPRQYAATTLRLFKAVRDRYGDDIELLHDVHERLNPSDAIRFAKKCEPFGLYFLEDVLPLEQTAWYEKLRAQTSTPIATGELFNNPKEWEELVVRRQIDFLRIHVSQIGGITPALKVAHFADAMGIRLAWHTPSDITPVGLAVNAHLNVHLHNASVQENLDVQPNTAAVFAGYPVQSRGFLRPSDEPGIGVSFDVDAAAEFPGVFKEHPWTTSRTADGTLVTP